MKKFLVPTAALTE